jgi:hypothetical protein
MMSRPDDIDEKKQQQWQSRVAQERLDLSASVEEALVDASANEDVDADELENDVPLLKSTPLIPPRLSLQSKPLPVVSTSVKVQTNHIPLTKTGKAVSSSLESLESFSPVPGKQRSSIRTTKVRLQVVPKPEASERPGTTGITPFEVTTNPTMPAQEKLEVAREPLSPDVSKEVSGVDRFEKGQSEIMVANTHITATSVVIVVLTADPGPVVVQYVTLHPKVGFTVHLSATAKKATSFNYRIC